MLTNNIFANIVNIIHHTRATSPAAVIDIDGYSAVYLHLDRRGQAAEMGNILPCADEKNAMSGRISITSRGGVKSSRKKITDFEEIIVFHFEALGENRMIPETLVPTDISKYCKLFHEALEIWERKEVGYKYKATAIFYEILSAMQSDDGKVEKKRGRKSDDIAERARDIIDMRFSDPKLTISELAKELSVSEAYLRRVFTQKHGTSPRKYLDGVRADHARLLIASGITLPNELARLCGFSDIKYFRAFLKNQTGYSPY